MSSRALFDVDAYLIKMKHYDLVVSGLDQANVNPEDIARLRIHSANMIDNETRDGVDTYLLSKGEVTVSHFLQDKHYIPRLLISAGVFLIVYLFMSLVVRDPIPMVDELIIAGLLSVLSFLGLSKRDVRLARESKLLHDLKRDIRCAEVIQEEWIERSEAYIYDLSSKYSILEMSDILSKINENEILPDPETSLPADFVIKMKYYLKKENRNLAYFLKLVKECRSRDEKLSARLVRAASNESLDLYLLAFLLKTGL